MTYIRPTTQGWTSQLFGTNPGGYNPAGGHTGEDIAVPVGTPLVAMADGVVVHVGYFSGAYSDNPWWISPDFAGYVVTVDYGPYISHYAHCSGSPVLSGRRVRQGEVVAYSGNSGTATSGPHCHWEVMPDGWDFNNGCYGRIDPRTITGAAIAPQGNTSTPPQEDELSDAQFETIIKEIQASRTVTQQIEDVTRAEIKKVAASVWSYTNPGLGGGDAYQILRDALANTNKLAADVAKVASKAATGGATEAQITEAVKKAISESIVNVDVTVGTK